MRRHHRSALIIAFSLGMVIGCGQPQTIPVDDKNRAEIALNDVAEMYRQYTADKHAPPKTVADFAPMEQVAPLGLRALQQGEVIARSGVVIQDTEEGPASRDSADEVIAYAKEVPASGGAVLMHNRTVRKMTPEEFKAAKIAGDGDMAAGTPPKAKKR